MKRAAAVAVVIVIASRAAVAAPSVRTQVLLSDGVSDTLIVGSVLLHADDGSKLGLLGVLIGAPLVHAANDGWARAGWSFLARVGMPTLGFAAGVKICDLRATDAERHQMLNCIGEGLIGGVIGLIGAQVLDATVISRPSEPTPVMLSFGAQF